MYHKWQERGEISTYYARTAKLTHTVHILIVLLFILSTRV